MGEVTFREVRFWGNQTISAVKKYSCPMNCASEKGGEM